MCKRQLVKLFTNIHMPLRVPLMVPVLASTEDMSFYLKPHTSLYRQLFYRIGRFIIVINTDKTDT